MQFRSALLAATAALSFAAPAQAAEIIRVATFNASLNRNVAGQLMADLSTQSNAQAKVIAEIIQRVNPDIILINEFDYDAGGVSLNLFQQNYLSVGQNGQAPVNYAFAFTAPSNTGVASGFDLNNNGAVVTTPGAAGYGDDSLGFGLFEGQFGMALYSKYAIDFANIRTFQNFLWQDMPGALLPDNAATPAPQDFYTLAELAVLPLSSKSHWDIPVNVNGEIVHILAAHPTPPTFDGPEDRNGLRNHDEIRLWADYVSDNADYLYDDNGQTGGLAVGETFVILGDYNADPNDGDSAFDAIDQLLLNPQIDNSVVPQSDGAAEAAGLQGGANPGHTGNPAEDTADFADFAPGNLRVDYVLGSVAGTDTVNSGVFWPKQGEPGSNLTGTFPFPSSDHRLVFKDLNISNAIAAVPEPGTWAMMIVGFGATGFAMRRRRVSVAVRFA